jgi:tetratricopeptide (TPR) repeat protein
MVVSASFTLDPCLGLNKQGILHLRIGRMSEAESCFRNVLSLDTHYSNAKTQHLNATVNLGLVLRQTGKPTQALACFDRATLIDPGQATPWFNKGLAFYDLQHYAEAHDCFEKALKIDATDINTLCAKAMSLRRLAKHAEAIQVLRETLRTRPDAAEIRLELGNNLAILGDREGALSNFEAVIKLNPKLAVPWLNLAQMQESLCCGDPVLSYSTYLKMAGSSESKTNIEFARKRLAVLEQRK